MTTSDNQTAANDCPRAAEQDSRSRTRIPDMKSSAVSFSTPTLGVQTAQLEDVSLGGFALRIADASSLTAGQELAVTFDEGPVRARVKYVANDADQGCRVGLEWVQPQSPVVLDILTRCMNELYTYIVSNS
jgi:hypothetical protein